MTDQDALRTAQKFMAKWGMQPVSEGVKACAALLTRSCAAAVEAARPEIERRAADDCSESWKLHEAEAERRAKVEALEWAVKEAYGWAVEARSKKRRGEYEANDVREDEARTCQAFAEHIEAEIARLQAGQEKERDAD